MGMDVSILGALNFELNSNSASNMHMHGKCVSVGGFYIDWTAQFFVPMLMVVIVVTICLLTRAATHQVSGPSLFSYC